MDPVISNAQYQDQVLPDVSRTFALTIPQLPAALQTKQQALANSANRGNAPDDLKSAAGEIYTELKKLLGLQRCGNSTDAFMRDTLAPLVSPPMATYQALKAAIIERVNK